MFLSPRSASSQNFHHSYRKSDMNQKIYLSHSKPPSTRAKSTLSSEALSSDVRRPSRNTTRPADQVRAQRLWTNTAHLLLFSVYARVVYDYDYADLVCVFLPYLLFLVGLWTWGRVAHPTILLILTMYGLYTRSNDRCTKYESYQQHQGNVARSTNEYSAKQKSSTLVLT